MAANPASQRMREGEVAGVRVVRALTGVCAVEQACWWAGCAPASSWHPCCFSVGSDGTRMDDRQTHVAHH